MGVRALCDVRQAVVRFEGGLDWQALTDRAAAWGAANAVGLTLSLAGDLLGAKIPAGALERLTPGGVDHSRHQWALGRMVAPAPEATQLSPYFWGILRPGGLRRKLGYLRRLALPVRGHIIQKYADPEVPGPVSAFYGARLKANLGRYLRASLALLRGDEPMRREAAREIENLAMVQWMAGRGGPENGPE
jgi:hypothetical protein